MTLAERTSALIATVEQYRAGAVRGTPPARGGRGAHDRPRRTERRPPPGHHRDRRERKRQRRDVGAVEASLATETATRGAAACRAATGPCLDGAARSAGQALVRTGGASRLGRGPPRPRRRVPGARCEWRIRHHAAWQDDERRAASASLRTRGVGVAFEHDPALVAGFVVTCGHNVLDASIDGLLADPCRIEGRLLQRLEDVPT